MQFDGNKAIMAVISLLLALVGFGVVVTYIASDVAQPAYPAATTITVQENAALCESLDNGWWDFTTATGASAPAANAQLTATTCPVEERWSGARALFLLIPLVMVGGVIAAGAVWLIHTRRG